MCERRNLSDLSNLSGLSGHEANMMSTNGDEAARARMIAAGVCEALGKGVDDPAVTTALLTLTIQAAAKRMPPVEVVEWLRDVADTLERRYVLLN
ncbi:MAG: hypothetical protein Q8M31_04010 [Beijerinckiaceae bacterium]|nr:hypothetical protein [Beijerinckiaceae bacterium]